MSKWAWQTLVLEMIVAANELSKDDHTLYWCYGRSPSGMPASASTQFVRGEWYSLIAAMSVDAYVSTRVVNGSVDTAEFFYFIVGEVASILFHIIFILLIFYNSSLQWITFQVIGVYSCLTTVGYINVKSCKWLLSPRVCTSHAYIQPGSHKVAGCILKFIPAYSPDLNPIEESSSAGEVKKKEMSSGC